MNKHVFEWTSTGLRHLGEAVGGASYGIQYYRTQRGGQDVTLSTDSDQVFATDNPAAFVAAERIAQEQNQ